MEPAVTVGSGGIVFGCQVFEVSLACLAGGAEEEDDAKEDSEVSVSLLRLAPRLPLSESLPLPLLLSLPFPFPCLPTKKALPPRGAFSVGMSPY